MTLGVYLFQALHACCSPLSSKKAGPVKRIQIHGMVCCHDLCITISQKPFAVVEAQGLAGNSGRCPPAYVTIESPGMGMLHQTGTVSKGKKLVWHENTRM